MPSSLLKNTLTGNSTRRTQKNRKELINKRTGQYLIVDLKLDMDPEMTVRESHAIATSVKKLIFDRYQNVGDIMIHVNPHEDNHEDLIRL